VLKTWLVHPLARGLDLDDPKTTALRRQIIDQKPFLRDIYTDWYTAVAKSLPSGPGRVLELGSGAGFLRDFVPDLITSEMFLCPAIRVVLDGLYLPFGNRTLRAIAMTNVLHHLPDVRRFFIEAARCVRPGGAIVMVEPWVTRWSTTIYSRWHHEPFHPEAETWDFASTGPLSGANGALPWILFERDRVRFQRELPVWSVEQVEPFMPFRYLVSGGVSLRSLMPGWTSSLWSGLEAMLGDTAVRMAMFARIVLRRSQA
jgi:SAM-dependent methyltransferase